MDFSGIICSPALHQNIDQPQAHQYIRTVSHAVMEKSALMDHQVKLLALRDFIVNLEINCSAMLGALLLQVHRALVANALII